MVEPIVSQALQVGARNSIFKLSNLVPHNNHNTVLSLPFQFWQFLVLPSHTCALTHRHSYLFWNSQDEVVTIKKSATPFVALHFLLVLPTSPPPRQTGPFCCRTYSQIMSRWQLPALLSFPPTCSFWMQSRNTDGVCRRTQISFSLGFPTAHHFCLTLDSNNGNWITCASFPLIC